MSAVRVLIADDHPLFRDGMHGLLESVEGTEVAGEASDGDEAVRLAGELRPDVILFLSLKIVQNHVSNIFRKLRVADRVQAALRAREVGLGG